MNEQLQDAHLDEIDAQLASNPGDGMGEAFSAAWYLYVEGTYTLDDYLYSLCHLRQARIMEAIAE